MRSFATDLGFKKDREDLSRMNRRQLELALDGAIDDRFHPEMRRMERQILLSIVDETWKNHLLTMDHLRSSVGLKGYAQLDPFVLNFFENIAAVQFNHRLLATLALVAGLYAAIRALWLPAGRARHAALALGGSLVLQYALGVATLLWVVPVWLGTLHQGVAVLVLTAAILALHATRRPARIGVLP